MFDMLHSIQSILPGKNTEQWRGILPLGAHRQTGDPGCPMHHFPLRSRFLKSYPQIWSFGTMIHVEGRTYACLSVSGLPYSVWCFLIPPIYLKIPWFRLSLQRSRFPLCIRNVEKASCGRGYANLPAHLQSDLCSPWDAWTGSGAHMSVFPDDTSRCLERPQCLQDGREGDTVAEHGCETVTYFRNYAYIIDLWNPLDFSSLFSQWASESFVCVCDI